MYILYKKIVRMINEIKDKLHLIRANHTHSKNVSFVDLNNEEHNRNRK